MRWQRNCSPRPSRPWTSSAGAAPDVPDWTRLPRTVARMRARWSLHLQAPFHGGSCSWGAPATCRTGPAVLKISQPHRAAVGEAEALCLWDGHRSVRLLPEDRGHHALLLERCTPGHPRRSANHLSAEVRLLAGAEILPVSCGGCRCRSRRGRGSWRTSPRNGRPRRGFGYGPWPLLEEVDDRFARADPHHVLAGLRPDGRRPR
ncbi:hypothetical protein EF918_17290 [Streptomyces sp. WAC06614]|nr:hypothetical protein EF918_17290 [Streptomyces sp. WAC06614]